MMAVSGSSLRITLRRVETLGGVRWWHPDVDDRHLRVDRTDQGEQLDPIAGLADHPEPRTLEQAGQAFTQQDVVVGQHHPRGALIRAHPERP